MQGVRSEQLNGEAKRLFEAIMKIADERDELKKRIKEERQADRKISKYVSNKWHVTYTKPNRDEIDYKKYTKKYKNSQVFQNYEKNFYF